MLARSMDGSRMYQIEWRGRCLRCAIKPWSWPYSEFRWGMRLFGAGPVGFMYWPKREA